MGYVKEYDLKARECENAFILPRKQMGKIPYCGRGGVVDSELNFVEESADYDLYHDERKNIELFEYKFGGSYQIEQYAVCEDTVIYGGLCHIHWGHFLMDVVQRLWFFLDNVCSYSLCFSAWENDPESEWKGNYLEFFELFGIGPDKIRIIYEPTRFRKVIVPGQAIWPGEYYHPKYMAVFDRVVNSAMKREVEISFFPRKIYLSRQKLREASRKEIGEAQLEKEFLEKGFTALYFEKLSTTEQIQYLNRADEVASISGTLTHNILFCLKPIKLIYLNKCSIPLYFQLMVNEMRGIQVNEINVFYEPFKKYPISIGRGPFYLKITDEFIKYWENKGGTGKKQSLEFYKVLCDVRFVCH